MIKCSVNSYLPEDLAELSRHYIPTLPDEIMKEFLENRKRIWQVLEKIHSLEKNHPEGIFFTDISKSVEFEENGFKTKDNKRIKLCHILKKLVSGNNVARKTKVWKCKDMYGIIHYFRDEPNEEIYTDIKKVRRPLYRTTKKAKKYLEKYGIFASPLLIYEILKKYEYIDEEKEKILEIVKEKKIFSSYRNDLEFKPVKIYEGKIVLLSNGEKKGIIVNTNNSSEIITIEGMAEREMFRNIKRIIMTVSR